MSLLFASEIIYYIDKLICNHNKYRLFFKQISNLFTLICFYNKIISLSVILTEWLFVDIFTLF